MNYYITEQKKKNYTELKEDVCVCVCVCAHALLERMLWLHVL